MELKHKSEWPILKKIADTKILDYDQTILLFALREVEDGKEGSEFNCLDSMGNNLDAQTRAMCNFIKRKDIEYKNYILRSEGRDEIFSFIDYISFTDNNSDKIKLYVEDIKKEFETMPKEIE